MEDSRRLCNVLFGHYNRAGLLLASAAATSRAVEVASVTHKMTEEGREEPASGGIGIGIVVYCKGVWEVGMSDSRADERRGERYAYTTTRA